MTGRPPSWPWPPWPALACAAVFFLAWGASGTAAGQELDERLLQDLEALPGSHASWAEASAPGDTLVGAVVLALGIAACLALREARAALGMLAASLVAPLVWGAKLAIGRARPETLLADGYALPSGHAALTVAAYGALALVLVPAVLRHGAPAWLRPAATGTWIGLAFAVGVARVAAGVHWPTDVVAGWAFGGLVLACAVAAARQGDPVRPTPPAL